MPVYFIQGRLGTGKGKYAVRVLRDALYAGRRVATNLDLELEHLCPGLRRASYIRVPDKPSARDLLAMGHGNPDSYDESRNGVLILDELGTWLNARSFQDKERAGVLDWMIHARKHGWDVYFIAQSVVQVDKQLRESLIEYLCTCKRLDKMRIPIPFIGWWLSNFGVRLPRMHVVTVQLGMGENGIVTDREFFRGDNLHKAYDTRQVFVTNPEAVAVTRLAPSYFQPEGRVGWLVRLLRFLKGRQRPKARIADAPCAAVIRAVEPRKSFWGPEVHALPPGSRWRAVRTLLGHSRGMGAGSASMDATVERLRPLPLGRIAPVGTAHPSPLQANTV